MEYGQFAYCYDRLMDDMPYPRWIEFAEQFWDQAGKPERVAELGCGTGNLTIPFALKGYQLHAIDRSRDMLHVAQEKWEQIKRHQPFSVGGTIEWLHQDARTWQADQPMDACISFCDSLNYILKEEELCAVFRQTYASLRSGGTFVFDLLSANQYVLYEENEPFIYKDDHMAYLWSCHYDEERTEIEHDLTIFDQSATSGHYQRIDEIHRQRAYSINWVLSCLKSCGFSEVNAFGDFQFQPADEESLRLFFCAVK